MNELEMVAKLTAERRAELRIEQLTAERNTVQARALILAREVDELTAERDALAARVAELEEQLSRVVAAAEECGWNGVENSKILADFIRGQGERLAVLEAPPIVPKGCTVRRCLDGDGKSYWDLFAGPVENDDDLVWAKERLAGYRALVWAIEHDQRPPHEGDSSHGPD